MMKRFICTGIVALLTACAGTQFTWDQARAIKVGMSEAELSQLMGKPHTVRAQGGQQTWVWVWVDTFSGTRTVSAVLQGGKVVEAPSIPSSF